MNDDFWDGIFNIVHEGTKVTYEQYQTQLKNQENTIIEFLKFICYNDVEEDNEVLAQKKEILSIYTEDISKIISKIEVYNHDLDSNIVEAIFQLFQCISCAEFTEDAESKKKLYQYTLFYTYFLRDMVQILLAKMYFDRIKMYNKILKDFNYKGNHIGGRSFACVVKGKRKDLKRKYKACKKIYLTHIKIVDNKASLLLDKYENDIELSDLLEQLEELIDVHVKSFPEIVNNGYRKSKYIRLVMFLLNFLSGALIIYGFFNILT